MTPEEIINIVKSDFINCRINYHEPSDRFEVFLNLKDLSAVFWLDGSKANPDYKNVCFFNVLQPQRLPGHYIGAYERNNLIYRHIRLCYIANKTVLLVGNSPETLVEDNFNLNKFLQTALGRLYRKINNL